MTYLLDTSAISLLMRADPAMAAGLSAAAPGDRMVTCAIVRGEILFGIERLASGRRRTELEWKAAEIFAALPCEPVPCTIGHLYATVKCARQRRGLSLDDQN